MPPPYRNRATEERQAPLKVSGNLDQQNKQRLLGEFIVQAELPHGDLI
jgi:hypothetical protein